MESGNKGLFPVCVVGNIWCFFGVLFCAYATYEAAIHDVQQWIVPSPTAEGVLPAQIWSSTYSIQRGSRLSQAQLEDLLLGSGYLKVQNVEAPGDFEVLENRSTDRQSRR